MATNSTPKTCKHGFQEIKQLLLDNKFDDVIQKSTEVIESDSNETDKNRFLILRSEAYFSTEAYTDSLTDIIVVLDTTNISDATKFNCHLIKGKCLVNLEEYESAHSSLTHCRTMKVSDIESLKLINVCNAKLDLPLEAESETAPVARKQVKHDFYQTDSQVVISILAKKVNKEDVSVECDGSKLTVNATLGNLDKYELSITLFNPVKQNKVKLNVSPAKIEITLQKISPYLWPKLEGDVNSKLANINNPLPPESIPVTEHNPQKFPSSSKKTRDWGKLEAEIVKEEQDEKPEGDAAVNKFFKEIYGKGSDEQKRAMMKSFQESNGTVLSTNWDEIGKGPVDTKAPDGLEFKKYEY